MKGRRRDQMERDKLVSAKEARQIIEERLNMKISQSKVSRLMQKGEIPSQDSVLDARKRLIRLSDLERWIEKARRELEGAAA
jgi:hypothetical protein